MLVLSRRIDQQITIGDRIEVKILEVRRNRVKLGITCDKCVPIRRQEVTAHPRQIGHGHCVTSSRS